MGLLAGVGAFMWWGFAPVYFRLVDHINPWVVLAHRGLWSAVLLGVVLLASGRWHIMRKALGSPRMLIGHALATVLIAANWFCFIYTVQHRMVLYASLGYFLNPLLSVALGVVVLGERLGRTQELCVVLAGVGVAWYALALGQMPWMALAMAGSFALYGLLRKRLAVNAMVGVWAETMLMVPAALVVMALIPHYRLAEGTAAATSATAVLAAADLALLALSGIVTALPLVLFGLAAARLRLSTVGLLQYLAPTVHFLLATLVYDEPFDAARLVAFGFIWSALLLFSTQGLVRRRVSLRPMA